MYVIRKVAATLVLHRHHHPSRNARRRHRFSHQPAPLSPLTNVTSAQILHLATRNASGSRCLSRFRAGAPGMVNSAASGRCPTSGSSSSLSNGGMNATITSQTQVLTFHYHLHTSHQNTLLPSHVSVLPTYPTSNPPHPLLTHPRTHSQKLLLLPSPFPFLFIPTPSSPPYPSPTPHYSVHTCKKCWQGSARVILSLRSWRRWVGSMLGKMWRW